MIGARFQKKNFKRHHKEEYQQMNNFLQSPIGSLFICKKFYEVYYNIHGIIVVIVESGLGYQCSNPE